MLATLATIVQLLHPFTIAKVPDINFKWFLTKNGDAVLKVIKSAVLQLDQWLTHQTYLLNIVGVHYVYTYIQSALTIVLCVPTWSLCQRRAEQW